MHSLERSKHMHIVHWFAPQVGVVPRWHRTDTIIRIQVILRVQERCSSSTSRIAYERLRFVGEMKYTLAAECANNIACNSANHRVGVVCSALEYNTSESVSPEREGVRSNDAKRDENSCNSICKSTNARVQSDLCKQ